MWSLPGPGPALALIGGHSAASEPPSLCAGGAATLRPAMGTRTSPRSPGHQAAPAVLCSFVLLRLSG